jgi:hypothetical protein
MTYKSIPINGRAGPGAPASLVSPPDFSRYREFEFGASLPETAEHARLKVAAAKAMHQRPAVIQELRWHAPFINHSSHVDSLKEIVFGFYNNELFRIAVTYDQERIEGLMVEDIIESVSETYGEAVGASTPTTFSLARLPRDGEKNISDGSEKIIARWEDAEYSFNLFQLSFQSTFGMVMYSKQLDALARASILEAIRLDAQEAPQRETELQLKREQEKSDQQAKARELNKVSFRP